MRSGVPTGSVLGLVLLNIFVGDMDKEIATSASLLMTELHYASNTLEGTDGTQGDLGRLEK